MPATTLLSLGVTFESRPQADLTGETESMYTPALSLPLYIFLGPIDRP